jgi:hypothetical protein
MSIRTPTRLKRAFQWDLGRQIERLDFLLEWLPRYADWGYEQVYLYLEDAFDFPSEPGVGRHRALTPKQMDRLVAEAGRRGMQVVPIVPLMGHTAYLMKVKRLRVLSELRDASGNPLNSGQVCPLHEGTLALARNLIRDIRPYCTAGIAHVGLDESFDIGKCPRCRKEVERIGLGRHFANHAIRLHRICRELGLRMGMWADMLYYVPEAIAMLPKDVIGYDWFYYPFQKLPRVELYNFADVDLTGAMRRAGLDVFGCPNNGSFIHEPLTPFLDRLRNIVSWWDYCQRKGAHGMMITSWSPVRTPIELNCYVDAAAASLWLNPGEREPGKMLELGFERVFGAKGRRGAPIASAAEKYQFTGYYRWQANTAWTKLASLESPKPWKREEAHFVVLTNRAKETNAPAPLRLSLEMRRYVAVRDRFVREGALQIASMRKAMTRGATCEVMRLLHKLGADTRAFARMIPAAQGATRAIWARSRYADDPNPNEVMLDQDAKRVAELQRFLRNAAKRPQWVFRPSPLFGRWQLLFRVRNTAPALQGAAVEIRSADGTWQTIHFLYSLEFTAEAGRPRADFRRRHSVSLDWDGRAPLPLRLAVRGMGQLEIYDLQITDGVRTIRPSGITHTVGPIQLPTRLLNSELPGAVLGHPAPRKGFPPIDWSANQAWAEVCFAVPPHPATRYLQSSRPRGESVS